MNATQQNRDIEVVSPFGKDKLLLRRLTAREELGRPFEMELELLSEDENLPLGDALGRPMTIKLQNEEGVTRHLSGLVGKFTHTGRHGQLVSYHARLVPW